MKRIMGFFLALVMVMGFLSLNPIASYANDNANGDVKIKIDDTHFPDPKFKECVSDRSIDRNGDGYLNKEELDKVTEITVCDAHSSLQGIEYFKNLIKLTCCECYLTGLDLSKNTKLEQLECEKSYLTSLDVSKNKKLTELCVWNGNLKSLDVRNNTELTVLNCGGNQLTKLDVSNNKKLTYLNCLGNKLTKLDVSNNTELTKLECNDNQLTKLDVSKNKKLTELTCHWNKLTNLDLGNNTNYVPCYGINQRYDITVDKNTRKFKYSDFPGRFDKAKVASLVGATLGDDGLTVNSNNPSEVTYDYEVNSNDKMQVELKVSYFDPTHVKKMVVKEQPTKLSYTAGEKLDLSGLVVTLTDNQGGEKNVTPAEFGTFNITAKPENKETLTLANNGKPVNLSKQGVRDAVTKKLTVKAASASAGAEYIAESEAADATTTLYRLYNPYTHEHLFTTDAAEKDNLVSLGWNFEGIPGKVYMHGEKGGVYRLYNPTTGEHHYTTKEDEVATCVKAGWKNEGVKFFSVLDNDKQTVGMVSMYNPYEKKFYHHYTADADEIAKMVKAGWIKEEVKWYAAK